MIFITGKRRQNRRKRNLGLNPDFYQVFGRNHVKTLSEKVFNGIDVCNAVGRYLRNPHLPPGKGQEGQKLVCHVTVRAPEEISFRSRDTAYLPTSAQFTSLKSSISVFKDSGTGIVTTLRISITHQTNSNHHYYTHTPHS